MARTLRYRVARLFAHDGRTYTNDDEAAIKALPREVRDHHIQRGNLVEYPAAATGAAAPATPTKTKE